jgi:peptide-methionine (S)-S-oxide reductase
MDKHIKAVLERVMSAIPSNPKEQEATFGGGCFWCLEPVFSELAGVHRAVVGYAGGHVERPTYQQVCSGTTGHAEVIQITYDPEVIRYTDLLQILFSVHDPTTLNRQGADVGTQYRSMILYHDEGQRQSAEAFIKQLEADRAFDRPIVTELAPLEAFYPAEDYHQGYFDSHPEQAYCRIVISPKVSKFRSHFADRLKQGQIAQG